jgi:DNA-binding MarR family transcriptional regulator
VDDRAGELRQRRARTPASGLTSPNVAPDITPDITLKAPQPAAVDAETRASADDHLALRLWLRLLACTNRIEAPLKQRLRQRFAGSLPRFDLMAQLERHPQGLKMRELSRRLMVTGGNVTGLTDRLVAEGLVQRREDPRDRRAFTVSLTAEGRRQFRTMAREHEGWVVELLGGIDAAQQAELYRLLGELKRTLEPPA